MDIGKLLKHKWSWIAGGIILWIIIVIIVGGGEEKSVSTTTQPQVSQRQIEEKVSLSVSRDYYRVTTDKEVTIKGTTSPEAIVKVNEKDVKVNERGEFTTLVSLKFGENLIKITAKIGEEEKSTSVKIERITQEEMAKREAKQKEEMSKQKETQVKEQIGNIVKTTLKGENNLGVAYFGGLEIIKTDDKYKVNIVFNANDNAFGNKYIKGGIEQKMTELYKTLFTSGQPISTVTIGAQFPTIDKYGYEKLNLVYSTTLEKAEAVKVNWSEDISFLSYNILPRVWTTIFLHPAFSY